MKYETISFANRGGVALIKLSQPETMNALNRQMRAEITHAVNAAQVDARVIVLTGEGRAFCSGQDVGDNGRGGDIDLERTLREEYEPMLLAVSESAIPTLAAVNGPAAGAGANLALAADITIACESAYFVQSLTRIGLIPDGGGTWALPRKVGLQRAMGAAFFSDRISARQAAEWGMIYEACPDEEFAQVWTSHAAHLATGPTETYKRIKTAMRVSLQNSFQDQLDLEARLQGECGKTRDFKEGMLAFHEKRGADFEGR